jgi:hypothetical protein
VTARGNSRLDSVILTAASSQLCTFAIVVVFILVFIRFLTDLVRLRSSRSLGGR